MLPRNVGQRCLFASDTPVDIPRTSQGTSFVNALHGIPCLSLALEWFYRRIWLCAAFAIQHQLHPFARHVEPISTLFSSLPILLRSLLTLLRAPSSSRTLLLLDPSWKCTFSIQYGCNGLVGRIIRSNSFAPYRRRHHSRRYHLRSKYDAGSAESASIIAQRSSH